MRVFLCGGGSGDVIKCTMNELEKLIDKNKPMLYVPLAMDSKRYDGCYEWIKSEMSLINVTNIEMVRNHQELFNKDLDKYSFIYIGGGNTYKLLSELKLSGSFDKIKEYMLNDGIILGGSAGVIIFGKDIDSCKMQDSNDVLLKDTSGFDILNGKSLLCHLDRDDKIKFDRDKNSDYLIEFSKDNKIMYLPDDDTLYVSGDGIKLLGNSSYRLYSDGKYEVMKEWI